MMNSPCFVSCFQVKWGLIRNRGIDSISLCEMPALLGNSQGKSRGGTLTAKADAVLSAAAAGDLAPTQAAQLITALGSLAKITEIDELAARITALETQHEKS
jgi:hypothetical protein